MASSTTSDTAVHETELQIGHFIDISEVNEPALHDVCCIYKVPPNLKKLNKDEADEVYAPLLISIGPFHHEKTELKPMQTQKQRYFLSFWERVTNKKALFKFEAFLKENIQTIKHSYSEANYSLKNDNDQFVHMILLDSVFILELFLRKSKESEQKNDYMFTTSWICKSIQRDLLLLENQLPIFVLEELYQRVHKRSSDCCFLNLAFKYFEDYYRPKSSTATSGNQNNEIGEKFKSCKHFTDLIRLFYLPEKIREWIPLDEKDCCVPKTATKLHEAGISFKKVHNRRLLEIKLKKNGVLSWFLCFGCLPRFECVKVSLQIPQLRVLQATECVLRNLIALEQCHYSDQPFICSYVSFIDSLIHTQEDVELLVDKEIIVHELGCHDELATMINGLCKNVVVNCNYYNKISKKLNDHYSCHWKQYMGMLRAVYFRDPWRCSSTLVGIVVFLFAIFNFLRLAGLHSLKY